jgi:hypothetical protein
MNKETEETVDKIISILKQDNEDLLKEFPSITLPLILTTYKETDLLAVEKKYNIRIPKSHRDFIERYSPERFHIMFTDIYGISSLKKELESYIPDELLKEGYLPFAGSDGNYYCLSMESDDDRVYFFDHEEYNISKSGLTFGSFFKDLLSAKVELDKKNSM